MSNKLSKTCGYKHRGAAGIIFIGLIPILFLILAFSIAMSQRLVTHVRMLEASEVASLALAADPKGDDADDYASKVIDRYLVDNQGKVNVDVNKKECKLKTGCVRASGESAPYTDISVTASSQHESWVTYEEINLESHFQVGGKSKARKYLSNPMDIYLIVDFSSSMLLSGGPGKTRLKVVSDTIVRALNEVKSFKVEGNNRVALLGYSSAHVKETDEKVIEPAIPGSPQKEYKKKYIYEFYRGSPTQTVRDMFNLPRPIKEIKEPKDTPLFGWYDWRTRQDNANIDREFPFFNIPLNTDIDGAISKIKKIGNESGTGTTSWNGIIAAAVEANSASFLNPEQVFIIFSDGIDQKKYGNRLKQLVDRGLCRRLKSQLQNKRNNLTKEIKIKMGVIGVNYVVRKQDGFGDCVGPANIYHAKNGDDVYKHMINIIKEETGRLRN